MVQHELDKSISYLSRALRINPKHSKAHYNMGNVYVLKGDIDKAIFHFSEALKIDPTYEYAKHNLEIALKEVGLNQKKQKNK